MRWALGLLFVPWLVAPTGASAANQVGCGYGTGGAEASTLCWLDLSGYRFAQSSSGTGQQMSVTLPGGYTISFNVLTTPNRGLPFANSLAARKFPTFRGAYIGNRAYVSTQGMPALYQTVSGAGDIVTVRNILVTDSSGNPVSGYGFVVADAESTDNNESITFSSDKPLRQISTSTAQFPYCGKGLTGVGTTTVTCTGGQTGGAGDGAIVLQADTPTQISAALVGAGLQGEAFAIVTSKITVAKALIGRVKGSDSFDLTATSPEGTVIGTASTGSANSASTGALTVLPRTNSSSFTLSEAITPGSGTLSTDYSRSWSCANAATGSTTPLPSGSSSSVQVSPAPGDDITCTVTNTQLPADLSIVKTPSAGSVSTGQGDAYTLTLRNNGPSSATNVIASDPLPAGASFLSASQGCGFVSGAVTCTLASLPAGASQSFSVLVKLSGAGGTRISNTAMVGSATPDSNPGNNSSTSSVAITPGADLTIVKSASPTPAVPGTEETYTLEVNNSGPDEAMNVSVSDPVPAGLSFVSASPGCSFSGGTVSCTLSSLAAGGSHTFTVRARVASSRKAGIVNTATVSSDMQDPDPNNNSSTASAPLGPKADLRVVKTASADSLRAGGQVMYTLAVANDGPSDATAVTVTDPLPAGFTVVSATPSQGSCKTRSGVVCDLGTVVSGGSAQVVVTANVAITAGGSVKNSASVTGDQPDPDDTNNTSQETVNVLQPPAAPSAVPPAPQPAPPPAPQLTPPASLPSPQPVSNLKVLKHASVKSANPGEKITYILEVANLGPDAASDVKITDTSSLGLRVSSVHASLGRCHIGVPITCVLGTVASGAHAKITILATVKRAGTENNTASVTAASHDTQTANNVDAAETKIVPFLRLRKTASRALVSAGQTISYRITVTNPSAVAVAHVTVCDRIPAALLFVSSSPSAHLNVGRDCWTVRSLSARHSKAFTLVANAAPGPGGRVVNHATASAPGARGASATAAVRVKAAPRVPCGIASAVRAANVTRVHKEPIARIAC